MEKISTGLSWSQIQELFDADSKYNLVLNNCQRRASLKKRKNGIEEERKVWRLIIQKDHKNFTRTSFRKNLKDVQGEIADQKANDKIVAQINNVIS
jgi:hypothetical protein